ncbi:hypothetical protein TWF506_004847 [Arthrobotrys conoides]|uniref:Uncharacterized protein n=1 Tax=Arthrobotrys conoides TaxID=74498 RepID=A0AAN8RZ99_9PEZI
MEGGRVKAPTVPAGHLNLLSDPSLSSSAAPAATIWQSTVKREKVSRFAGLHMKTRGVGMSTNPSSRYSKVEAGRGRRQGYRLERILIRTMALLLQICVATS